MEKIWWRHKFLQQYPLDITISCKRFLGYAERMSMTMCSYRFWLFAGDLFRNTRIFPHIVVSAVVSLTPQLSSFKWNLIKMLLIALTMVSFFILSNLCESRKYFFTFKILSTVRTHKDICSVLLISVYSSTISTKYRHSCISESFLRKTWSDMVFKISFWLSRWLHLYTICLSKRFAIFAFFDRANAAAG